MSLYLKAYDRAPKPSALRQHSVGWLPHLKNRIEDFSLGVFLDVIKNSKILNKPEAFSATPKDLPILIFSGDKDPIGEMGKGVTRVAKQYEKRGISDLTFNLYEGVYSVLC